MEPEPRALSPDGRFLLRVYPWEARMSHWVETPELYDARLGQLVWHLYDRRWSLIGARWLDSTLLEVRLCRYPGEHNPPELSVRIDCAARTAEFGAAGHVALDELERALALAIGASP